MFEYIHKVGKFTERNTCIDSYFFDFKDESTAFSSVLIENQAKFVAEKVAKVTKEREYTDINLVTHSLGSYVAYKAMDLELFPVNHLKNVISLASPNIEAPHQITADLTDTLIEIRNQTLPDHVAYFHFDGGVRDFFVGQASAKPIVLSPTSVIFKTE